MARERMRWIWLTEMSPRRSLSAALTALATSMSFMLLFLAGIEDEAQFFGPVVMPL